MKRAKRANSRNDATAGTLARALFTAPDFLAVMAMALLVFVPGVLSGTAWVITVSLVMIGAMLRELALLQTQSGSPTETDALMLTLSSIAWMFILIAVTVATAQLADTGTALRVMVLGTACHLIGTMVSVGGRIDLRKISLTPFATPQEEPWT